MDRISAKDDFVFKKIFGNPNNTDILTGFLNSVLGLTGDAALDDVRVVENTYLDRDASDDKLGILDVRAETRTGEHINIEIQLANPTGLAQRTLWYWGKIYTEQLKKGGIYENMKKTICINIVDFNYISLDRFHTSFHIREDIEPVCKLTEMLEIHFLDLPKFRKSIHDLDSPLDRWLMFLENSPEEVIDMITRVDSLIAKAERALDGMANDDEYKALCLYRDKLAHDQLSILAAARQEERRYIYQINQALKKGESPEDIADRLGVPIQDVREVEAMFRSS